MQRQIDQNINLVLADQIGKLLIAHGGGVSPDIRLRRSDVVMESSASTSE